MNYGLAKEIYGTPWCIDSQSFLSLSSILKNIQNGVKLDIPDVKLNSIYMLKNETKIIDNPFGSEWNPGQLDNNDDFEAIGLINLNGPITRNGGMSSNGTNQISSEMLQMSKDKRIKGFLILNDSGGGASGAVKVMSDAINEIRQTKPVYTLIPKGGMSGSAAYGIASASTKIYSEDEMNIVGSCGTMISFDGYKANSQSKDGVKHITVYASKSTMKNKAFEEALNNDNYSLLVSELLDPINEAFINLVSTNRPQLVGTEFDNGHTSFSKDAIGTFIDGIASYDEVVNMLLSDAKNYNNQNKNSVKFNSNSKMTKEDVKSQHPLVYSEIVTVGMTAERERVASWMVYQSADHETVAAGITSGEAITPSQREALMVKMNSKSAIDALKADSQKDLGTIESSTKEKEEKPDTTELESAFNFNL